mgnify:CR=1 FL=1|jgi:hypothetical protein
MDWDEIHRNEQRQRRDQERQQREKDLRDQQQRQHEDYMKQQNRHFDRLLKEDHEPHPQPRGGAPLVVWFFGGIGALFGGLNPPLNWDWFFGGTLGFLVGGFLGGYLSQRGWGRAILWSVGLAFVGLIAFGIYRAK